MGFLKSQRLKRRQAYSETSSSVSSICLISPSSNSTPSKLLHQLLMYASRISSGRYTNKNIHIYLLLLFKSKAAFCYSHHTSLLLSNLPWMFLPIRYREKLPVSTWGLSAGFREIMNSLKLEAKRRVNVTLVFKNIYNHFNYLLLYLLFIIFIYYKLCISGREREE